MKNKTGPTLFFLLFLILVLFPPRTLYDIFVGFHFIGSDGDGIVPYQIDVVRFTIITLLIVTASYIIHVYLSGNNRNAIELLLDKLKIRRYLNMRTVLVVGIISVLMFITYYYYTDYRKIRTEYFNTQLSDNIKTVLQNKGKPLQRIIEDSDSSRVILSYDDLFIYFYKDSVYLIRSNHYGDHYNWSYQSIIENYGEPTVSWFNPDSNELMIYSKYNLFFGYEGNGRENKKIFTEGMVNYNLFNRINR